MMRDKLGFERGAFARTAAFGGWITFSTHSERISVGGKLFRIIASSVVESGLEMEDCWDISFLRERNEGQERDKEGWKVGGGIRLRKN